MLVVLPPHKLTLVNKMTQWIQCLEKIDNFISFLQEESSRASNVTTPLTTLYEIPGLKDDLLAVYDIPMSKFRVFNGIVNL